MFCLENDLVFIFDMFVFNNSFHYRNGIIIDSCWYNNYDWLFNFCPMEPPG